MWLCFIFPLLIAIASCSDNQTFLGCYENVPSAKAFTTNDYTSTDQCRTDCGNSYYSYAAIRNKIGCTCINYLGSQVQNETCAPNSGYSDIYLTGKSPPGPAANLQVNDITESSVRLSWQRPNSFIDIISYQINATVIHTYSSFLPNNLVYTYSNNTAETVLNSLLPGSKYNLSLRAISSDNFGPIVSKVVTTIVGQPSNITDELKILDQTDTTITISIDSATNDNGPVSAYQVIVVDDDGKHSFDRNTLHSYDVSRQNGLPYYITAELSPFNGTRTFVVGDGKRYGNFYNAPLDPNVNYDFLLGVKSELNGISKYLYSPVTGVQNGVIVLDVDGYDDNSAVIVALSIAIGLLSLVLVAGIVGFILLRNRVANRRQRLSDNQELTLQGPMIEVENNGYIHEDDLPVNHYKSLKQKLRTIPLSQLQIETNNVLGVGKFGHVNSGIFLDGNEPICVAAYNIQDKKMGHETKRSMLHELDLLIRTGRHENVVSLLGTCETAQFVCVVMDYVSTNLKDFLLGSRDTSQGRFTNITEAQALNISMQIARGMAHLESCRIVHKQLCARSIVITGDFVPKISSYGLAQYHNYNKTPDYTRWTALEVFKGQTHNPKSDVWSFACLIWEIYVLGGTPYGNVPNNNEIPGKIIKGLRLPQLQYFSDDLYQLMLDCWQIDFDERPKFLILHESLKNLNENNLIPHLSFNLYSNFQYEQFYPDMELSVRPVY